MREFEYLIGTMTDKGECTIGGESITLRELGEAGWELISVGAWAPNVYMDIQTINGESVPMMTHRGTVASVVFKRVVTL